MFELLLQFYTDCARRRPPRSLAANVAAAAEAGPAGDCVARTDDFFEVDGDSLMAITFMMDLERALGLELSLTLIIKAPTFARRGCWPEHK